MTTISADENKYKGKWTGEQGEERSIIYYVVTRQEYMETIKSKKKDEQKQYEVYKTEPQNKQIKKTSSNTLITMLY